MAKFQYRKPLDGRTSLKVPSLHFVTNDDPVDAYQNLKYFEEALREAAQEIARWTYEMGENARRYHNVDIDFQHLAEVTLETFEEELLAPIEAELNRKETDMNEYKAMSPAQRRRLDSKRED
jgi:hypothetical protein